jgi:hypothetical protein
MAVRRFAFGILAPGAALIFLGHCGGATPNDDPAGAALQDAGQCEGTGNSSRATPAEHRAQPVVCGATNLYGDAGALSCTTDADCQSADSGALGPHCLQGHCGLDECRTDGDCATGNSCVCGPDNGTGDRELFNVCVPSNCRVDSDCGSGGFCVPSRGYCGGVTGMYCLTSKDTCSDPTTDCPCQANACVYAPQVSHWVCGSSFCAG